jgi:ribosomal protein S18 acetylase RimI-like enzyme
MVRIVRWPDATTISLQNLSLQQPKSVMSRYQVRPAIPRDAMAIADIYASAIQAAYQGLIPDEQLGALSATKRQGYWREAVEMGEPQIQVAVEGEQVVGFVGFDRSRDPKTPSTMGEIWQIYVTPALWSTGAGLALWDAARDGLEDEGCTDVTLWLPLRNERALAFHEKAGFKRELASAKTVEVGSVKIESIRLKRSI